jgi:hypothetical protein
MERVWNVKGRTIRESFRDLEQVMESRLIKFPNWRHYPGNFGVFPHKENFPEPAFAFFSQFVAYDAAWTACYNSPFHNTLLTNPRFKRGSFADADITYQDWLEAKARAALHPDYDAKTMHFYENCMFGPNPQNKSSESPMAAEQPSESDCDGVEACILNDSQMSEIVVPPPAYSKIHSL